MVAKRKLIFLSTLIILFCVIFSIKLDITSDRAKEKTLLKPFDFIHKKLTDHKFRQRVNKKGNPRVVIISIDEKSLKLLGRWQSWSRDFYAKLIDRIHHYNASALGFDIVFDQRADSALLNKLKAIPGIRTSVLKDIFQEIDTDSQFERALKKFNKSIVMGYFIESMKGEHDQSQMLKTLRRSSVFSKSSNLFFDQFKSDTNIVLNHGRFNKVVKNHGFFSMTPDYDGVVRRYKVVRRMKDKLYPSLGLAMIQKELGLAYVKDSNGLAVLSLQKSNLRIPLDEFGEIPINYYGPQNTFKTVSFADVISDKEMIEVKYGNKIELSSKKDLFEKSLVLVGATATGIYDVRNTPMQVNLPGVEVHATFLSMMLDKRVFLSQKDKELALSILFKLISLLVLSFLVINFNVLISLTSTIAILFLSLVIDQILFNLHINLQLGVFYFSVFLIFILLTSVRYFTEEKEKQKIKSTFKRFVANDVVEELINSNQEIELGGRNEQISCLFTDIADFTSVSEGMDPQSLSNQLNEYLGKMTEHIFEYRGTLDKYIGDSIMAFWGAPIKLENHAERAVQAALKMLALKDEVRFQTRIGIHTGEACVGNIGSNVHMSYTAIGDTVNTASRLEALNKYYGTAAIISEQVTQQLREGYHLRKLDKIQVKGKDEGIIIYELRLEALSKQVNQTYSDALESYFSGEFEQASQVLKLSQISDDTPSVRLLQRCEYMLSLTEKEQRSWDGIWKFEIK